MVLNLFSSNERYSYLSDMSLLLWTIYTIHMVSNKIPLSIPFETNRYVILSSLRYLFNMIHKLIFNEILFIVIYEYKYIIAVEIVQL
jgi:hypothetical protein